MVIHSLLPAGKFRFLNQDLARIVYYSGYLVGYSYFTSIIDMNHPTMSHFWAHWPVFWNLLILSFLLPVLAASIVWYFLYILCIR